MSIPLDWVNRYVSVAGHHWPYICSRIHSWYHVDCPEWVDLYNDLGDGHHSEKVNNYTLNTKLNTAILRSYLKHKVILNTKLNTVFFPQLHKRDLNTVYIFLFFNVRLLSLLRGHSFFHPRHNGQWPPTSKDFLSQILSITFIFLS